MNKSLLEKLLDYYGLSYEQYLKMNKDTDLDHFDDGLSFEKMDEAVKLVKDSIDNNDSILIYGDYDADGIMGTSILVKMFHYIDKKPFYYVPSRYFDGYGINMRMSEIFVKKGIKLVICVDNGVSAIEPIKYLKDNGVKVLVLDHHTPGEELPNADCIIHPILSHFSDIASSGAFTAFMFSRAFLGYSDKYLSILASISLISDLMPLKGYNRALLRTVFREYQVGEFLPIDLLANNEGFDENIIGMSIAPRINSIGRLVEDKSINDIIHFFLNEDKEYVLNYFNKILEINNSKIQLKKEADATIEYNSDDPAIIFKTDAKEGLIGLLANPLVATYKKPVVVFSKGTEPGILKGSARSPEGFNIVEAFNKLSKYLVVYGGHAGAGGCSLKEECYEDFKNQFIDLVRQNPPKVINKYIEITLNDLNKENYELIRSFSPFGMEFKAPKFKLSNIKAATLSYSKNLNTIQHPVGIGAKIVCFSKGKKDMENYNFVDMYGTFSLNKYRGYTTIQFVVDEIKEN